MLLLDLSGARRRREEVDGARLSVLGDGDTWDGRAGDDRGTPVAPAQPPQRADVVAALDVARLCDAARAATPALRVRTPRFELALAPDEATRVVASEGRPATVLLLRLDLVRRAPEPPAR